MNANYLANNDSQAEEIQRKARQRVVETLANNMELYGISLSNGYLYGTLLFNGKPMTLDEMVEALGMSKTSMSTGVRTLMDLKMVNKVWAKGMRKDHYEVEQDWYQSFIDFFALKWRKAVDLNTQALNKTRQELAHLLETSQDNLSDSLKRSIENDLAIIRDALDYYDWLSRLIDSFESEEIFQFVPKRESKPAD
ncbi:GbsR/MarR family transcriptional regulator [Brevibacillus massiliensis]|jgi:DNA-binding transcriptional regulator GbsR (MarR family)|uniref:GbsR/MarR family transcriptional regulator n=1 Tax=Brevibacillus massiliensis TaxID=1118054 RepID=UPI00036D94DF|nr:GbsR/MarR family transcriptional regulator [Brevibacillus massiliensis]